jgi:hypothetical protein
MCLMPMNRIAGFLTGARVISGDVCLVRLSVITSDEGRLDDLRFSIDDSRLREEISKSVKQALGPEFEVRSLAIGRGSIEIMILIGTVYYAISRYKNFVESMELMVQQLKEVVRYFFERTTQARLVVNGSWAPIGSITQSSPLRAEIREGKNTFVVWYLIVSHAGMLAVLLWLLVMGLKP